MIDFLLGKKQGGILNTLENIKKSLIDINITYSDPSSVEWSTLINQVHTKVYTQLSEGFYARVLTSPKAIKYDKEKDYKRDIQACDFVNNTILMVIFTSKAKFPVHYHETTETIKCLEGSFIGAKDQVFTKGEAQTTASNEPHLFKAITDGVCLITISNQ